MRVCGGSWEQWEDELTFPRLMAIQKSARECPPAYVSLFAILRAFGGVPDGGDKEPKTPEGQQEQNNSGIEAFIASFGTKGAV